MQTMAHLSAGRETPTGLVVLGIVQTFAGIVHAMR